MGKYPRYNPRTKLPGGDTDSIMTEKYAAQEQTQGVSKRNPPLTVLPRQRKWKQRERNPSQQIPNTDPMSNGGNDWQNQDWNPIHWGSFGYYNWTIPMMYWAKNPETLNKGKGGGHQDGQTKDKIQ